MTNRGDRNTHSDDMVVQLLHRYQFVLLYLSIISTISLILAII